MSFEKTAISGKISAEPLNHPQGWDIFNLPKRIKTASIEKSKDIDLGGFDLKSEILKHPDHLYLKIFAIKENEVNDNSDAFSPEELKKAYHTFVGAPVFTNHDNNDVEKARGECVHAWYDEKAGGIWIVARVDKIAYPKLARGIEESYISGTSMGCSVDHSICSVCHNRASVSDHFCSHIKEARGRKRSGTYTCRYHESKDSPIDDCPVCGCKKGEIKTYEIKEGKVFEWNRGLKFIENSFVVNPACHTCGVTSVLYAPEVTKKVAELKKQVENLYANYNHKEALNDGKMSKAANCSCEIKIAGRAELEMLKQSMEKLETVTKSMLMQKDQVDLDYVSDLVKTMSQIQDIADELTEMGYGTLPSPPVAEAGVEEDLTTGSPSTLPVPSPAPTVQQGLPSGSPARQDLMGGLGSVTIPKSSEVILKKEFTKISSNVRNRLLEISKYADFLTRRKFVSDKVVDVWQNGKDASSLHVSVDSEFVTEARGDSIIRVSSIEGLPLDLRNVIQENPEKAAKEVLSKLIESQSTVKESIMADNVKEAQVGTNPPSNPEQREIITEKQLQKGPDLHPRTPAPEQITESTDQIGGSGDKSNDTTSESPQRRQGTYDVITEGVLASVSSGCVCREKDAPDVITEKQWTDMSKRVSADLPGDWRETITEDQLRKLLANHTFVGTYEVVTEGQLKTQDMGIKRWANHNYVQSLTKVAMDSLVDAITVYHKSPDDLGRLLAQLVDKPELMNKAAFLSVINSLPFKTEERKAFASNAKYFNKQAAQGGDVSSFDALVLAVAENAKAGLKADDVFETIAHVLHQKTAVAKINELVKAKLSGDSDSEQFDKFALVNNALETLDGWDIRATVEEIGADPKDKKSFITACKKFAQTQIGHQNFKIKTIKVAQDLSVVQLLIEALQQVAAKLQGGSMDDGSDGGMGAGLGGGFGDDSGVAFEFIEGIEPENMEATEEEIEGPSHEEPESTEFEAGEQEGMEEDQDVMEGEEKEEDTTPFESEIAETPDKSKPVTMTPNAPAAAPNASPTPNASPAGQTKPVTAKPVIQKPQMNPRMAARAATVKSAQMMGGEMGGQGGAAQGPGAGATLPQPPMGQQPPVESFTEGTPPEGGDEMESDKQAKPPGALCCVCGSDDVDIIKGDWKCNNCNSNGTIKVSIEVTRWANLTGEEDKGEAAGEEFGGEGFEMPGEGAAGGAMPEIPVAAMTKITPTALQKLAESKIVLGSVSPITGSTNTVRLEAGKYVCLDTGTPYSVEIAVKKHASKDKPNYAYAQWTWTPKIAGNICPSCSRARQALVKALTEAGVTETDFNAMDVPTKAKKIVELRASGAFKTIKIAAKNTDVIGDYKKAYSVYGDKFPIESCREKLARRYGKNALALSGPCEGELIYDCVCNNLKNAGVYSDSIAFKVADTWIDRDGSEECIEDLVKLNMTIREAALACSVLKTALAGDEDLLADSLGEDKGSLVGGLGEEAPVDVNAPPDVGGLGDEDPFAGESIEGGETVMLELDKDLVEQLKTQLETAVPDANTPEVGPETTPEVGPEAPLDTAPVDDVGTVSPATTEVGGPAELGLGDTKPCGIMADTKTEQKKEGSRQVVGEQVDTTKEPTVTQTTEEIQAAEDADLEKFARLMSSKVGGVGKTPGLDYEALAAKLGLKVGGEKQIQQELVQKSKDIGSISAGDPLSGKNSSEMGHENETVKDATHPDVPRSDALIGHESDNKEFTREELPVIPSDKGTIGHESEQGLSGGDVRFTGGVGTAAPGAGQSEINDKESATEEEILTAKQEEMDMVASMRGIGNSKGRMDRMAQAIRAKLADKIKEKAPISPDSDLGKVDGGGKGIAHEEDFKPDTPKNTEGSGDESMMGHEKETLKSRPTAPKDQPDIPVDKALMGHEGDAERERDPEKQTNIKGTVIAGGDAESKAQSQKEAFQVAGKMIEAGIISADQLQTKVDELAQYTPDLIRNYEKAAFAKVSANKKGLDTASEGLERPLVIHEASSMRNAKDDLQSQLQSMFALDKRNKSAEALPDFETRKAYNR